MTGISALSIGLVYLTVWISNCHYYGSNAFTLYLMPEQAEKKTVNYRDDEDWPDIPQKTLSDVWIGYNPVPPIPEKTLSNVLVGYSSIPPSPETVLNGWYQNVINNKKESYDFKNNLPENWPQNNKLPESWPDYAQNRPAQSLTLSKRGKLSPAWSQLKQKRISQAWYEEQTLWPDYLEKRHSNRLTTTNRNDRLAKELLENSQLNRMPETGFKEKRDHDISAIYQNYLRRYLKTNIVIEDKNAVCTRFDCTHKACCSGVCADVFGSNMCLNYG